MSKLEEELGDHYSDFGKFLEFYENFYKKLKLDDKDETQTQTYLTKHMIDRFKMRFKNDLSSLSEQKKKKLLFHINLFLNRDEQIIKSMNNIQSSKNQMTSFQFNIMYMQITILIQFIQKNKISSGNLLQQFLTLYTEKIKTVESVLSNKNI
jgi:hypothetical protein